MSIEEDQYCKCIITLLMVEKEIGFNELASRVKRTYGFSRPTLSFHLEHLVKKRLVRKRKELKSKWPMKPCYYSLNMEMLRKVFPQIDALTSDFIKIDEDLKKMSVVEISYRVSQLLVIEDLMVAKLYLESFGKEQKSKRHIALNFLVLKAFAQMMLGKLMKTCEKAKQEDISKAIRDLDKQIDLYLK
ncbi:helix-turn-helix domain-containing protein [Candidatus Bathyarchaeota archaeon]|nr:helix-turn-helix domain-containing protein [Candidatus Bathyarchaeota archaeon]